MKSRIKYITAIVATLMCLLVGFCMPQIVCKLQDEKIALQIKNEKIDSISEKATLIDKLSLVKNGYSALLLEAGIKMTEQEAMQAAKTELKTIFAIDIETDYTGANSVFFALSKDARIQAVFWEIYLETEYSSIKLILDDETKKILSFTIVEKNGTDINMSAAGKPDYEIYEISDKLINHCASYYGFKIESIERKKKNYSMVTFKNGNEEVTINFDFSESSYTFNF